MNNWLTMKPEKNILELLKEKSDQLTNRNLSALILQPGAVGDCILTLPLIEFMKKTLGLHYIDVAGRTEYLTMMLGRTEIDKIRSMELMQLHRLFVNTNEFSLEDKDPLITTFADYTWIVTFMGETDSAFEKNLIFTANCSHSVGVVTLPTYPPEKPSEHVSDFYIKKFVEQSELTINTQQIDLNKVTIKTTQADTNTGRKILEKADIDTNKKLAVIQPGSGGLHKRWCLDNFLALSKNLQQKNIGTVFLLGPAELENFDRQKIESINKTAKCLTDLSLMEVLQLLSCADFFIGNDSGITHLAAGIGVKTIAMFGPTNPAVYQPIGPKVQILTAKGEDFTEKFSAQLQLKLMNCLEI